MKKHQRQCKKVHMGSYLAALQVMSPCNSPLLKIPTPHPRLQAQPVLAKTAPRKFQCTPCSSSVCISLSRFKGPLSTGKLTTGDESLSMHSSYLCTEALYSQLDMMATFLNNSRAQRALKVSREGKDKPESSLEKGSCMRNDDSN